MLPPLDSVQGTSPFHSAEVTIRFHVVVATLPIFLALAVSSPGSRAQSSSKIEQTDAAAIRQVFSDFYENFTRHDAHATAMTFAPDADFTNMRGIQRRGRKEIEQGFAALFAGSLKDSIRTDIVRNIRFFSPELASVDADTTIIGTIAADGSVVPPRKGLMIVTMTKHDGRWLISTFHEAEFPEARGAAASSAVNK
jgi:uncharacterized protein (TIGR02246 family)